MCAHCIRRTFWKYSIITLLFGWWGIETFLFTPLILIMNVLSYRAVFLSPPYPADEVPPVLSSTLVNTLEPYRKEIFRRLFKGESMQEVSEDIGERVGATAAEVRAFYNRTGG
jgi:hypothetical protein